MKKKICIICLLSFSIILNSQTTLKELALEQFKSEHYQEAVATLEKAMEETPDDAEIHYYIGFFKHYTGSDSRLYRGYNENYTEKILEHLDKAIELNPNYGDAKYFYGAECTARAFAGMQNRNSDSIKYYLERAYKKGAFPGWLIELGRNILNSSEQDAILFTAGDADLNVCLYLQVIENVRRDITILPIGNIDRPWFIQYIKDGLNGITRSVNIGLSDNQIMQIRPFKWKMTPVTIQVSDSDKTKYGLETDAGMIWNVAPDYYSDRMHSKIEGEEAQKRTYLSPQRGMLLQIVEDNMAHRPIFFTNFSIPVFYGGLQDNFQNYGLVSKLCPIKTENTNFADNYDAMEKLMRNGNFKDYYTIELANIPRISNVTYTYHYLLRLLAEKYRKENNTEGLDRLKTIFYSELDYGLNAKMEEELKTLFENK